MSGGAQSETITFCSRWKSRRYSTAIVSSGELSEPTKSPTPPPNASAPGRRRGGPHGAARRMPRRRRADHGEQRLERRRPGRLLRRGVRRPPVAAGHSRPVEQHECDAERERLLDHHHHGREPLVGERREPEQSLGLVGVRLVERVRAEGDTYARTARSRRAVPRSPRARRRSAGDDPSGRRSATRPGGRARTKLRCSRCARTGSRARPRTAPARASRRGRPPRRRS